VILALFIVPNATFIAEVLAFVILIIVVGKFIFPPLEEVLERRREMILAELREAEQKRKAAEDLEAERRKELEEARRKSREVLEQANRIAAQIKEEARARAEEDYGRRMAQAEEEIRRERERVAEELRARFGELVIEAAARILKAEIDPAKHREIIRSSLAEFEVGQPSVGAASPRNISTN
jgi:F-type H+-transporting ATPase subunit b